MLLPFNGWRSRHEGRIDDAKDDMLGRNGVVASWEKDVSKLSNVSCVVVVFVCGACPNPSFAKRTTTRAVLQTTARTSTCCPEMH